MQGKNIEFYMIYQDNFQAEVKGLFGLHTVPSAFISYKLLEACCISDYLSDENNTYPEWNLQEQGKDWPDEVKRRHAEITIRSTTKKKPK
jgi:hypothetical protein